MNAMTRDALISHIAAEMGVSKKLVRELFSEFLALAIRELKSKGVFAVPGLGRLVTAHRKARVGRNPQAGEVIKIAAHTFVKFRVDRQVQDRIARRGIFGSPGKGDYPAPYVDIGGGGAFLRGPAGVPVELPGGPVSLSEQTPEANYSIQRIFFATDREVTSTQPARFSHKRNPTGNVTLGTCDVSIPRDPRHHTARIERPSIWRFEFREDPKKHFIIRERTIKPRNEFYEELAALVAKSENKEAFVFIHGFRVAFDDAVYRTAQIAYDLGFAGAPVLYSWPSNGKIYEYTADINNNDWTVAHLQAFLLDLCQQSGAKTLHLIAHSMGNRALCNALNLLATKAGSVPMPLFNQVVLTAPDVDADVFLQLSAAVKSVASRVTLYASTHDKALLASRKINGSYPRAGDSSQNVVVVAGMDTIDASAVDTNFIGHFYYGDNRSVLSDIFNLLKDGSPPSKRFGMRRVDKDPPYWSFRP